MSKQCWTIVVMMNVACAQSDDDQRTTAVAGTVGEGTSEGGAETSTGLPPISTGTFTTMPAGESSGGESGLTEPIPGAESSGSEGGSPAELSCDAGCAPGIDCGITDEAAYDACFDACWETYDNGTAECVTALEALNDCLVELECTDYGTWLMGTPPDVPCNAENEAKIAACGA